MVALLIDYSNVKKANKKANLDKHLKADKEAKAKALRAESEAKAKLEAELLRSNKMLSNEAFVSKAPQAKLDAERAKQKEYQAQYDEVCEALNKLNK